ncbi:Metallo-beta-lactamase superfamily protein [Favolaschia claudopus]|uniref:Metallo-beta-lactamase superfamily protein n=1 Tax=Favolaschia claudopus TaxID=2862362 RepID=A0AAW0BG57_9AGAR
MSFVHGLFISLLVGQTLASWLDYGIPPSSATVDVRVFNVVNVTLVNAAHTFIAPVVPTHEDINLPVFSFLVEHKNSNKRLMFDLGIRKDTENLAPSLQGLFTSGTVQGEQPFDITELLQAGGIPLESIDSVIWSHAHFDHIGDMSKFPNTTDLIIGSETNTETFPDFPNATLQASDFAQVISRIDRIPTLSFIGSGRQVTKIDFSNANLIFSGMKAIDFFRDGSFYLLNTPGHHPGHLTALARVTPTTFILLGGDTFHHVGEARPRPALQKNFPCPAHILEEAKTAISTDFFWSPRSRDGAFDLRSRSSQLLAVSDTPDSFYADPVASQVSLEKIATFDADPDVFVVIAHDISIRDVIPYFPASLNDWKARDLKEKTLWSFIEESNPASVFRPSTNATV